MIADISPGAGLRPALFCLTLLAFTHASAAGPTGAVTTGAAATSSYKTRESASGMQPRVLIEPVNRAMLSSEIAGRIARLPLREGDAFKKGDLLLSFDCRLYRAELLAAQADATSAEQRVLNARQLAEFNSIGGLEVALAEAELQKAKARLQVADVHVDGCDVRAPFNGRVVELRVREHESVGVGAELISLVDASRLELELIVPSSWLAWVKRGQTFEVLIDETGGRHPARITAVGAQVDPVSQSVKLRGVITGAGGDLTAGMSGTALFPDRKPK